MAVHPEAICTRKGAVGGFPTSKGPRSIGLSVTPHWGRFSWRGGVRLANGGKYHREMHNEINFPHCLIRLNIRRCDRSDHGMSVDTEGQRPPCLLR